MMSITRNSILSQGVNCRVVGETTQFRILPDGENYFKALYEILPQAKSTIYIYGWEIDSQVELVRGQEIENEDLIWPTRFIDFLDAVTKSNPMLDVYIMCWDYSMFYALEREHFQKQIFSLKTQGRIKFLLNKRYYLGGSNHQKCVVLDDKILFIGGMDITRRRVDTTEHKIKSKLRTDPTGRPYGPFHDIQLMLEGDIAKTIGQQFRDDWQSMTGTKPIRPAEKISWPMKYPSDYEGHIQSAVSFTRWSPTPTQRIKDNHQLFIDLIKAAENYIYIESQYLTADAVVEQLCSTLKKAGNKVEVILLISARWSGYVEHYVLGSLSQRSLIKLRENDRNEKLRVVTAVVRNKTNECYIKIHSKFMLVDDHYLKIGSSNLNNRSLHLDSEMDIIIEASESKQRNALISIKRQLLAEHLGTTPDHIEELLKKTGNSLCELIDHQDQNSCRKLVEVTHFIKSRSNFYHFFRMIVDPKFGTFYYLKYKTKSVLNFVKKSPYFYSLLLFLIIAIVIYQNSSHESLIAMLESKLSQNKNDPALYFSTLAYFALFATIGVPLNLILPLTSMMLPLPYSILICYSGTTLALVFSYLIGRIIGPKAMKLQYDSKIYQVFQGIKNSGVFSMTAMRLVPLAPFFMVNIFSGFFHLKVKTYLLGSLIGLTPGILAFSFFGTQVKEFSQDKELSHIVYASVILLGLIILTYIIKRKFKQQRRSS